MLFIDLLEYLSYSFAKLVAILYIYCETKIIFVRLKVLLLVEKQWKQVCKVLTFINLLKD